MISGFFTNNCRRPGIDFVCKSIGACPFTNHETGDLGKSAFKQPDLLRLMWLGVCVLFSSPVFACSCPRIGPCEAAWLQSNAIFVGRVGAPEEKVVSMRSLTGTKIKLGDANGTNSRTNLAGEISLFHSKSPSGPARGCLEINVRTAFNGRVSGRVTQAAQSGTFSLDDLTACRSEGSGYKEARVAPATECEPPLGCPLPAGGLFGEAEILQRELVNGKWP